MKLSLSMPRLMPAVMAVTMEKMVQIDADIEEGDPPSDDESSSDSDSDDQEVAAVNSSDGPIFALEVDKAGDSFRKPRKGMDDSDDESSEASDESEDTTDDESPADTSVDENMTPQGKLDALMFLSLDFVKLHMLTSGESAKTMFEVLWKEFVRVVMPTYHSKHVQYLLFYACRFPHHHHDETQ